MEQGRGHARARPDPLDEAATRHARVGEGLVEDRQQRSRSRLDQRMREAELARELFDGIFADEDQPFSKPDPRCFEPVWAALGGKRPEQAIYVGDRHDDLLAARGAGLTFVGVRTGPELHGFAEHPPEHVLDSAAVLPSWLEAQR